MKPHLLITNDDGIEAEGIKQLAKCLAPIAELTIVAPATERSGAGVGLTLRDPLQIREVVWEGNHPAWKINGTPADCVRLGLRLLVKKKPDLIVSGINRGSNAGRTVLYSGTVGGVIEGAMRGVPGIAVSCVEFERPNYRLATHHLADIVAHFLKHPLARGTILNVNIPSGEIIKGFKMAQQGRSYWIEDPQERIHPDGDTYYWLGGKWNDHEEHEESDVALLQQGYLTAVPIHVDQMTDFNFLNEKRSSFESLFR